LDKSTGMTAADMRSLAAQIPAIGGGAAQLPTLNRYFPVELQNNGYFAVGPEGAKKAGSPVPTELIDFSASPELSVSTFLGEGGDAKMMLLNYPTPALARAQEEKLIEWAKQQKFTPPNTLPAEGEALNTFQTRRVGPIVAVITGAINASEAKLMLEKLHYDAEITLHEPSGLEAKNNIGSLVYAAVLLAFMIIAIALIMGLAFGGFRVMAKRWYPGRFVDRPQDVEFIKLDIGGDGK
jgi:hypothetical protein